MKSIALAVILALVCGVAQAAPAADALGQGVVYLPADPQSDILIGEATVAAHLAGQALPDYRATRMLVDGATRVESGYVRRGDRGAKYIAVRSRRPDGAWRLDGYAENPSDPALGSTPRPSPRLPRSSPGAERPPTRRWTRSTTAWPPPTARSTPAF